MTWFPIQACLIGLMFESLLFLVDRSRSGSDDDDGGDGEFRPPLLYGVLLARRRMHCVGSLVGGDQRP